MFILSEKSGEAMFSSSSWRGPLESVKNLNMIGERVGKSVDTFGINLNQHSFKNILVSLLKTSVILGLEKTSNSVTTPIFNERLEFSWDIFCNS